MVLISPLNRHSLAVGAYKAQADQAICIMMVNFYVAGLFFHGNLSSREGIIASVLPWWLLRTAA